MELLFRLSPELRNQVFTFMSPCDLDRAFGLSDLVFLSKIDGYVNIQHEALRAQYRRQNLVMSNEDTHAGFTLMDLNYLIRHNVHIAPKEITIVLYDFTNYTSSIAFLCTLFLGYWAVVEKYTRRFNIQLILAENVPLDNVLLKNLFEPFCLGDSIAWFTIKYYPALGRESNNNIQLASSDIRQQGSEIAIDNLKLHLFSSSNLLKHLADGSGCFYCANLRSLDLSYNNLADHHLRELQFPPLLRHLNLSRNQISEMSSLRYRSLVNLEALDLSNNNITSVELRDRHGHYLLRSLNLSGNILRQYGSAFEGSFFASLEHLDLSHNLLERLTPLPLQITSLDVTGNYFSKNLKSIEGTLLGHLCEMMA